MLVEFTRELHLGVGERLSTSQTSWNESADHALNWFCEALNLKEQVGKPVDPIGQGRDREMGQGHDKQLRGRQACSGYALLGPGTERLSYCTPDAFNPSRFGQPEFFKGTSDRCFDDATQFIS